VDRRSFIGTLVGGLLAAPLAAEAQQAAKVYRIGMLETRSTVLNAANIEAFRQGLRDLGYKEGENFEIVYRSADGRDDRFPALASELVRLQVDLILTRGTPRLWRRKVRRAPFRSSWRQVATLSGLVSSQPRAPGRERDGAEQRDNRKLP
jgi:putative ABC transport system substrate-binding protein